MLIQSTFHLIVSQIRPWLTQVDVSFLLEMFSDCTGSTDQYVFCILGIGLSVGVPQSFGPPLSLFPSSSLFPISSPRLPACLSYGLPVNQSPCHPVSLSVYPSLGLPVFLLRSLPVPQAFSSLVFLS